MTVAELRAIANEMGYNIIKKPPKTMLLPCICGCNRREHWYGTTKENAVILKCMRCGKSVSGRNEINARVNWNKEITREMER